jgi:4'-phosphopantetheinyl transferase
VDAAARRAIACAWLEQLVEESRLFAWPGIDARPGEKPRLRGSGLGDVSISHSGDLLFVAATTARGVGVDIEAEPFEAFSSANLVSRMCTPTELQLIAAVTGLERVRWLADVWTSKEATVKASGHGIARDFRSFPASAAPTSSASGPISCIAVVGPGGQTAWHRPDSSALPPAGEVAA